MNCEICGAPIISMMDGGTGLPDCNHQRAKELLSRLYGYSTESKDMKRRDIIEVALELGK